MRLNTEELKAFNEADKKVHPVEEEWHYHIMMKYGWEPIDKDGIGFVRRYRWSNSKFPGRVITYTIGYNSDYWDDSVEPPVYGSNFWRYLEPHLVKLNQGITE